jgi:hypothetical protein
MIWTHTVPVMMETVVTIIPGFFPDFSSSFVVFVRFAVLYVSLLGVKCEVNPCLEHRSAAAILQLYCRLLAAIPCPIL